MARPSKKRARVESSASESEVRETTASTTEAPVQLTDKEKAVAAFNKRWKVDERTAEEVLGA